MLICTPMCTAFSNIQNLNKAKRDPDIAAAEIARAREHLKWCCRLYQMQVSRGAYFLHEHPAHATSWKTPEIEEVMGLPGVQRVVADQCQLGQETENGDPMKKPTGFMSNAPKLLHELDRRCFGKKGLCSRPRGGAHAECMGKNAQRAAIFQEKLCVAILRGLRAQLLKDGRMENGAIGVITEAAGAMRSGSDEIDAYREGVGPGVIRSTGHGEEMHTDDLTGLQLDTELCKAARRKEIEYFRAKRGLGDQASG